MKFIHHALNSAEKPTSLLSSFLNKAISTYSVRIISLGYFSFAVKVLRSNNDDDNIIKCCSHEEHSSKIASCYQQLKLFWCILQPFKKMNIIPIHNIFAMISPLIYYLQCVEMKTVRKFDTNIGKRLTEFVCRHQLQVSHVLRFYSNFLDYFLCRID